MRSAMTISILIGLVVLGACGRGDQPSPTAALSGAEKGWQLVSCSTVSCIEDFLDGPCTGNSQNPATVEIAPGTYTFWDTYILDNCHPNANWYHIQGSSSVDRPVLRFMQATGSASLHATLHFAENVDTSEYSTLKDVILRGNAQMDGDGVRPTVQFEFCSVRLDNVLLGTMGTIPATTHFLSVSHVDIDGLELEPYHELVFGREDWCGSSDCSAMGGGGAAPPTSVSVDGSILDGDVSFELIGTTGTATFNYSIRNSDITHLKLQTEVAQFNFELTGNAFSAASGPAVVVTGNADIVAVGNETTRGPCESDALADFDFTGADPSASLDLQSWVYDGDTYPSPPAISGISSSFDPLTCTVTVTWTTDDTSSSEVFYGPDCSSTTSYASGPDGTTHQVVLDVSGITGSVAFVVSSTNACGETTTSACSTRKRSTCMGN